MAGPQARNMQVNFIHNFCLFLVGGRSWRYISVTPHSLCSQTTRQGKCQTRKFLLAHSGSLFNMNAQKLSDGI